MKEIPNCPLQVLEFPLGIDIECFGSGDVVANEIELTRHDRYHFLYHFVYHFV